MMAVFSHPPDTFARIQLSVFGCQVVLAMVGWQLVTEDMTTGAGN
jgi:hypothetical protein